MSRAHFSPPRFRICPWQKYNHREKRRHTFSTELLGQKCAALPRCAKRRRQLEWSAHGRNGQPDSGAKKKGDGRKPSDMLNSDLERSSAAITFSTWKGCRCYVVARLMRHDTKDSPHVHRRRPGHGRTIFPPAKIRSVKTHGALMFGNRPMEGWVMSEICGRCWRRMRFPRSR